MSGKIEGKKQEVRGRDGLDVGAFAALTLFLAVFCTDTFHLGTRMREAWEWGAMTRLTFAARHTVQARAPRDT